MSDSLWPHGLQHIRLLCPPLSPWVRLNSCPLSQWCHPTISFTVTPFAPALNLSQHQGLFQWIQTSHQVENLGASASVLVLPMNIQGWFRLGLIGLLSLLCKWLSRVHTCTTVQKHEFFSAQPSSRCNCHDHTWWEENHSFDYMDLCWQNGTSAF